MMTLRTSFRAVHAPTLRLMLCVILGSGAGCSDNKPRTVKGAVYYQGRPVPAAIVKFFGTGDHSSMAYVRDGAFIITDIPQGEVKVTVEADDSQKKSADGKAVVIPPKYADLKSSGLVFTIDGSTRELAIKLD